MKVRRYLLLLLLLSSTIGCSGWEVSLRREHWDVEVKRISHTAAQQAMGCDLRLAADANYKKGWCAGYEDVLCGGTGEPPAAPPSRYYGPLARRPDRAANVDSWHEGFIAGADAAFASGIAGYTRLPGRLPDAAVTLEAPFFTANQSAAYESYGDYGQPAGTPLPTPLPPATPPAQEPTLANPYGSSTMESSPSNSTLESLPNTTGSSANELLETPAPPSRSAPLPAPLPPASRGERPNGPVHAPVPPRGLQVTPPATTQPSDSLEQTPSPSDLPAATPQDDLLAPPAGSEQPQSSSDDLLTAANGRRSTAMQASRASSDQLRSSFTQLDAAAAQMRNTGWTVPQPPPRSQATLPLPASAQAQVADGPAASGTTNNAPWR